MDIFNMLKSNKKLFYYSYFIAFTFFMMGITNILFDYYFWFTQKAYMLSGIIETIDPQLLDKSVELTSVSIILLMVLTHIPVLISSLSSFFVGYFFFKASRGEIWTKKNIKILLIAGILMMLRPIINGLMKSLESLALSISLPAGEKIFIVNIGISTDGVSDMLYGVMIVSLALIMKETIKISDENKLYI